jgi:signal transduction histidine kinase
MSKVETIQEPGARTESARETDEKDIGFKIVEAQILGRSLAFLAHDIQNHLATINESAGWMKDLLEQKDKRGFDRIILYFKRARVPDSEAVFPELDTIQKQVSQVSALTTRLSSFAHRLEEKKSVIDANKILGEVMDVLLQETEEKGVHLELKQAKEVCMIEIDPLGFQVAVFENMKNIIKVLESGTHLLLETTMKGGELHVRFTEPNDREDSHSLAKEQDSQDFLKYMVEDLGGQLRQHTGNEKPFNTLAFALAGG